MITIYLTIYLIGTALSDLQIRITHETIETSIYQHLFDLSLSL